MEISENSRVWIYQANRPFSNSETVQIEQTLNTFTNGWHAHEHKLAAKAEVRYNRFIILMVDESVAGASGCSIDKSSQVIRELEQKYNVSLFDRFNMAYKKGEEVISCSRQEFEGLLQRGEITPETTVFNNTVQTKEDLETRWEVPFKYSWHSVVFQALVS